MVGTLKFLYYIDPLNRLYPISRSFLFGSGIKSELISNLNPIDNSVGNVQYKIPLLVPDFNLFLLMEIDNSSGKRARRVCASSMK